MKVIKVVDKRPVLRNESQILLDDNAVVFQFKTESASWGQLHECGQTEASCPLISLKDDVSGDRICNAFVITSKGRERGLWCGQTAVAGEYLANVT